MKDNGLTPTERFKNYLSEYLKQIGINAKAEDSYEQYFNGSLSAVDKLMAFAYIAVNYLKLVGVDLDYYVSDNKNTIIFCMPYIKKEHSHQGRIDGVKVLEYKPLENDVARKLSFELLVLVGSLSRIADELIDTGTNTNRYSRVG